MCVHVCFHDCDCRNLIYYKTKNGNTAAHLLYMCVQERAPLENIRNGAIWHIWRTYAKFSLK